LSGEGLKLPNVAAAIRPDIYRDPRTVGLLLVGRDSPPYLVVMVGKTSSSFVMDYTERTSILIGIVNDE